MGSDAPSSRSQRSVRPNVFGRATAAPRTSPEVFLPWNPALHEPRVQPKRDRVTNCRLPPRLCSRPLMPGAFFAGARAQESPAPLSTAGSIPAESAPCASDTASLSLCPCSRKSFRDVWTGSEVESGEGRSARFRVSPLGKTGRAGKGLLKAC